METPNIENIDKIMLIQPNNVTFGQYHFTSVQENILTLAIDALQKHATKTEVIQLDLFGQPKITVVCDDAAGMNNKRVVKESLRDMVKKPFTFKWVHPNMGKTIESSGIIFTTWHDVKDTKTIELTLNVWAIPFLVYYGVGVGGTRFNRALALNLRTEFTKRIYKIICRWKDKPTFTYPIQQFRTDLGLTKKSYERNYLLEEEILKPSAERIKESGSEVWFEYELICKNPVKGRKPKADTIVFIIHNNNMGEVAPEVLNEYKAVYNFLTKIWDTNQSSKAMDTADQLKELGAISKVNKRILFYENEIAIKKRTLDHAQNALKKMLRVEYKIDTESQIEREKREKKEKEAKDKREKIH